MFSLECVERKQKGKLRNAGRLNMGDEMRKAWANETRRYQGDGAAWMNESYSNPRNFENNMSAQTWAQVPKKTHQMMLTKIQKCGCKKFGPFRVVESALSSRLSWKRSEFAGKLCGDNVLIKHELISRTVPKSTPLETNSPVDKRDKKCK